MKKYIITTTATTLLLAGCGDSRQFDATGTFESANEITVSAEATGKIEWLDLQEGDSLSAGKEIGVIDTMQLYLSKQQLKKNMKSIRYNRPDIGKQIAATKEQIRKQEYEKQRIENLLKGGAATQKQLDDINSAISVLEKQLDAQLSTLNNTTGNIDGQSSAIATQIAQIDDRIAKSIIKSPVSGVVIAKYMDAGEYAMPGKPLFKVADMSNMYLRAYFTSEQLAEIKTGQKVKIYADFGDDKRKEYNGIVIWIASENEFTPKNIQTKESRADLVYAVKIAVINDGLIKIGTYGEVVL